MDNAEKTALILRPKIKEPGCFNCLIIRTNKKGGRKEDSGLDFAKYQPFRSTEFFKNDNAQSNLPLLPVSPWFYIYIFTRHSKSQTESICRLSRRM